ncbi:MAG TPA: glycoside hydrolase family 44 protein [Frankiaceae bacterium]|nr:glycoside hydrolase family 44 protein [Frankiaceae bacterium]
MTRLPAALLAAVLLPVAAATPARAADGPALAVDASLDRWAISPDVYGINFADPALQSELGLSLSRWGGNSTSRYNWKNNTTNLGADWYFENYVKPAGESLDATVGGNKTRGTRTVVTVPMTGWVSKDSPASHPWYCGFSVAKYGAQQDTDDYDADCGNGVKAGNVDVTGNDPHDTSVAAGAAFVQEMVAHLVATHGGGGRYNLDNEPSLWSSTHRDVHPAGMPYDELRDKSVATAKAVKAADPTGLTMGPAEWGWCAYFYSPADSSGCENGPDRQAHGDVPIAAWYLQQMKAASATAGTRLLDYFDEHYYPQASGVTLAGAGDAETQARRLRSTRSLWDPAYADESWIGDPNQVAAPPIRLVPWMRELAAAHYPGTRTMVGEYNWGGLESVNGALAQADVLGIFGRERLDAALLWGATEPTDPWAYAFRMYRNYDGNGSRFGSTNVRATSADQSKLAVYAAQRSADGAVTVMVVNKTTTALTAPLSLAGAAYGTAAKRYAYSATNASAIRALADVPVASGAATVTYEPSSVTLLVVPTAARTATALTAAVAPTAVTYGATVTVTGRLTSGGAGLGGRTVAVEAQRRGTTSWVSAGTATTTADGRLSKVLTPQWSATLRWRYPGDGTYAPAIATAGVTVRVRVSSTLSSGTVARGGTVRIAGSVAPRHPGSRVALQQWSDGWRTVTTQYLSSTSGFSFPIRHTTAGTRQYRVLFVGDADHAPGAGPTHTLRVT